MPQHPGGFLAQRRERPRKPEGDGEPQSGERGSDRRPRQPSEIEIHHVADHVGGGRLEQGEFRGGVSSAGW